MAARCGRIRLTRGTPAIAARTGGMTDVIEHGRTGLLCDPNNPADLAAQVRTLLGDHELAAGCVAQLRRRIRECFNWPAVARRIVGGFGG